MPNCCSSCARQFGIFFRCYLTSKMESTKINFLSDGFANRFQTGVNFGIGVNIRRCSILYRFTEDFNDYFKSDVETVDGGRFGSNRLMYHSISWGMSF